MATQVGIIAAVSEDGALAQGGRIPWDEPADRTHFRRITLGHTVIMGRRTWASLPHRPLEGRSNLVLAGGAVVGAHVHRTLGDALEATRGAAWLIGGARVYEEGYGYADTIELTRVPYWLGSTDVTRMPPIPTHAFERVSVKQMPEDPRLVLERWVRRGQAA